MNVTAGKILAPVGHDLASCTGDIGHYILPYPRDRNRRIILVDTPGFDDSNVDDTVILDRIATWLAAS